VPGYVLETLLGRGGSGEVWRAVPRAGGEPVAVKVLVAGDPDRQAREAALLGELDHPHLVRLLDVVHQPRRGGESRVALVLELLPGGSLAALLARRGRLRPGEVVTALAPVAAALAHAHRHGVVHGDLSPGNIVFTAEGRPVLTDLGVARVLGEDAAGDVTPAYVDPTVARGGAPGPASDVFGIAAAAFHALTGIPPWNAAGPEQTLAVAAAGLLPDLAELAPGAPAELIEVVARGLSDEPDRRGSAAALALDLRHACRPEPVRLPVAGVPDEELARTGRGPRTELTHQRPGRHAAGATAGASGGRPSPVRRRGPVAASISGIRPPGRRSVVLLAVALLGVLGCVAGWAAVRGGMGGPGTAAAAAASASASEPASTAARTAPRSPGPTREPRPADRQRSPADPAGWQRLVGELYRRRAQAFATGSGALLGDVYTAASRQLSADEQSLAALLAARQRVRGFHPRVDRVTHVTMSGDRATVALVDGWPPYRVVRENGSAVATAAGRAATAVRMVLARTPAGWRIDSVARSG
jgi:hypothetical protein